MRRSVIIGAALALIALAAWGMEASGEHALRQRFPLPVRPLAVTPDSAMAADGARLVKLSGCSGCHGDALTGQTILSAPFGMRLSAPNLTAAVARQTPQQLASEIRFGIKPDGTSLIGMPVQRYLMQSDGDVAAIIAYLKSLPPRPDAAEPAHLGFAGRAMLALGIIPASAKAVSPALRGPELTPSAPAALGAYLVRTQCSACHGRDLSGETVEHTPDLRFAVQHYSLPAFEKFFHTGTARDGHGTETMTPVIEDRFHNLTSREVQAIFLYLNTTEDGAAP